MAKVLLDFSNVRVGGGVIVAAATLQDLAEPDVQRRFPWLRDAHIRISPIVRRNITMPLERLPGVVSVQETGASPFAPLRRPRRRFDVRFTLFGPTYTGRLARCEITGFAEVTMLYRPSEYGLPDPVPDFRARLVDRVKRIMTKRSDLYVTETSAMADRLSDRMGINRDRIFVVPNRPHPLFVGQPILHAPPAIDRPGELHLAYPTRAYPHKNLAIVGALGPLFEARTGKRLVVHSTLRAQEWDAMPEPARRWMRNHGESPAETVLEIYRGVDAIFFPSLLEACSVTPLEANVLGVPLLASDRDFVRSSAVPTEVFDPTDARSVADALARFDQDRDAAWARARATAERYRRSLAESSRSISYLSLVSERLGSG